jgi:hypothetical protein
LSQRRSITIDYDQEQRDESSVKLPKLNQTRRSEVNEHIIDKSKGYLHKMLEERLARYKTPTPSDTY